MITTCFTVLSSQNKLVKIPKKNWRTKIQSLCPAARKVCACVLCLYLYGAIVAVDIVRKRQNVYFHSCCIIILHQVYNVNIVINLIIEIIHM